MARQRSNASASSSTSKTTKSQRLSTITEFRCQECHQHFLTMGALAHHMRNVYGLRTLHCEDEKCEKVFFYRKDLTRHQNDGHSEERPWRCADRNCAYAIKGFKRKDQLGRHERGKEACPKALPAGAVISTARRLEF
ncbi:hypothetical protein LTR62_008885 [Meristemomyces frigidus]|uniref:C2H2-type domain-containing protein n=1 Tax=Meristemomyces frigidus TaxID=1508187 RepID=A0AAN7YCF3_9PEZI|nr:hypothetical protein LTR62_008885 [Meristemomyces frigidus]